MSYLVPLIAVVFVAVVGCYLASVPQEEDHQYIIVILGLIIPLVIVAIGVEVSLRKLGYNVMTSLAVSLIGLGGLKFSESDHDPQRVCPRHQLPLSAILRSHSRQLRENPAIQRSEALFFGEMNGIGMNGDDGITSLSRMAQTLVIFCRTLRLRWRVKSSWNGMSRGGFLFRGVVGFEIRCIAWFEWLCILCLEDMSGSVGFKH
ncbi:hypothetical protein Tco_1169957, partial [Tanacetum coccineum]